MYGTGNGFNVLSNSVMHIFIIIPAAGMIIIEISITEFYSVTGRTDNP